MSGAKPQSAAADLGPDETFFVQVCSWCERSYRIRKVHREPGWGEIELSHGMCGECEQAGAGSGGGRE